MRRTVPVLAATAGALVLLANFHTTTGVSGVAAPNPTGSPAAAPPSRVAAAAGGTGSPPTSTTAARTIDGPVAHTPYGDVKVRITLKASRITDVQAVELPFDRSKSRRISAEAGPKLRSEALTAQSARIDAVSGASYTSDGYTKSLQGAIDAAGR